MLLAEGEGYTVDVFISILKGHRQIFWDLYRTFDSDYFRYSYCPCMSCVRHGPEGQEYWILFVNTKALFHGGYCPTCGARLPKKGLAGPPQSEDCIEALRILGPAKDEDYKDK